MTITEIVEQALAAQGAHEASWFEHWRSVTSIECARAACLAVAKAVVGECAKIAGSYTREKTPALDGAHVAVAIRWLAAQGPGGAKP